MPDTWYSPHVTLVKAQPWHGRGWNAYEDAQCSNRITRQTTMEDAVRVALTVFECSHCTEQVSGYQYMKDGDKHDNCEHYPLGRWYTLLTPEDYE